MRVLTTILPGHRIELSAPELPEGQTVEVIIRQPSNDVERCSMLDLLKSLPSGPRSFPTWQEVERHLQQERDSWDR